MRTSVLKLASHGWSFGISGPSTTVRVRRVRRASGRSETSILRANPIAAQGEGVARCLAAFSLADGSEWITLVTCVGLIRGTPGTLLTLYGPDGMVKQSATLDRPWSLMLHEKGRVRGVLLRNDVELDSVALNDSD